MVILLSEKSYYQLRLQVERAIAVLKERVVKVATHFVLD
jgi:hypothetical protein